MTSDSNHLMANANQIFLIETLITWTAQHAYTSFSSTQFEDSLRGTLVDSAILSGWTVVVNKNAKLRDVRFHQNKLDNSASQVVPLKGHNPDMRVTLPYALTIELKIRGEYGSSINAPLAGIDGDFEHVATGNADVFILLSDMSQYKNLRTGKGSIKFEKELPDPVTITTSPAIFNVQRTTQKNVLVPAKALALKVPSVFGERVVVGFYR